MKRVAKVTDWTALVVLLFAIALYAPRTVPVQWFWFVPGDTLVSDSYVGEVPAVGFYRVIKRDVIMSYKVTIRNVRNQVVCETESGRFTYRADAILPDGIDLEWWTNGKCLDLPAGAYVMETCWTAYNRAFGLLPPKAVCVDSNVFNVEEVK